MGNAGLRFEYNGNKLGFFSASGSPHSGPWLGVDDDGYDLIFGKWSDTANLFYHAYKIDYGTTSSTTATHTFSGTMNTDDINANDIIPNLNNYYDLGSSSKLWNEGYFNLLKVGGNSLIGNAGSAKKWLSWGGLYQNTSTGVLRIVMPTGNYMFSMNIHIRGYNIMASIMVGGYTYTSTSDWHTPQAVGMVSGGPLNVRFSSIKTDGVERRFVQIGDTTTLVGRTFTYDNGNGIRVWTSCCIRYATNSRHYDILLRNYKFNNFSGIRRITMGLKLKNHNR